MTMMEQARALAAAGRMAEHAALVEQAAAAGEAEALVELAIWRLDGVNGGRDVAAAHALLDQAVALGQIEAIRLKATLVGSGTGGPRDPDRAEQLLRRIEKADPYAAVQIASAKAMRTTAETAQLPVEFLSQSPEIRAIRGLLAPQECRYILWLAEPHLEPSYVLDPRTGQRDPHPVRTSSGMSLGPTAEDRVIQFINARLAQVTGTDPDQGEPLHVLRYLPGQQYRPHVDVLPGISNQRHWTVLVYLNDGYGGGATRFDRAGVEFAGREGDALVFRNVDAAGASDPRTRHAGLPVTEGTKWLATRWIRERRYHPWEEATW
jgi:prolyl 4-hydroxylase